MQKGVGGGGGITIVRIPVFKEETALHVKKTGQYFKIKMIAKPEKVVCSGKSRVFKVQSLHGHALSNSQK